MDPEFWYQSEEEQDTPKVELLKRYGIKKLCADMVGIWLKKIGFLYIVISNNYYIGGHENKDTIQYIHKFIDRYLLLERQMDRWIKMTTE